MDVSPVLLLGCFEVRLTILVLVGYALFYLWFESFPLVFVDIYRFRGGVAGLPFISLLVGTLSAYIFYLLYLTFYLGPRFAKLGSNVAPEEFLHLACFAGVFIPISLFTFGWSARASVHWIVPMIGAACYPPGLYLLFQSAVVYLSIAYPRYAASIFAGNNFFRSCFAAAFP